MGSIPILETSETVGTPTVDIGALHEPVGDNPMSQAMLRVLERFVGTWTGPVTWGMVTE